MADKRTYKTVVTFKDYNNNKISTRVIPSFGFKDLGQIPANAVALLLKEYEVIEKKHLFKKKPETTETCINNKAFMIGSFLTRQQIINIYGENSPEYQFILNEEAKMASSRETELYIYSNKRANEGFPVSRDPNTGLYRYDGWYLLRNGSFAYGWGYTCNLLDESLIDNNGFISKTASISNSTVKPDDLYTEEICSDENDDVIEI